MLYRGWVAFLGRGVFLLLGLFCRTSAIVAWFLYLCAVKSGNLLTYGVDNFTTTGLFYLMLAPFPNRHSLDWWLWKSAQKDRHLHGFFRRGLRRHPCPIYLLVGVL